jgi:hypothetical protein
LKNKNKSSWETLHGVCLTLQKIDKSLNFTSLKNIVEILKDIIERTDKDKNSFTVNSIAGQAVVQLFISLYLTQKEDALLELNDYFKTVVHPILIFMFNHPEAQVLDGAGSSFNLLLKKLPNLIEKEELMICLFKK